MVRDPGMPRHQLVHLTDLFPTLLEVAGVPTEQIVPLLPDPVLDGVSFLPALLDPEAPSRRDTMISLGFKPSGPAWLDGASELDLAVRDARWKLIRPLEGDDQLYDMQDRDVEASPLDLQDLDAVQLEALTRLQDALRQSPGRLLCPEPRLDRATRRSCRWPRCRGTRPPAPRGSARCQA